MKRMQDTPDSKALLDTMKKSLETAQKLDNAMLQLWEASKKPAEKGDPQAMYVVGKGYADGYEGQKRNWQKAILWYKKAASKGHLLSMRELGDIYTYGSGVPESHPEGKKWYEVPASKGDVPSMMGLAYLLRYGTHIPQNLPGAEQLLLKAANTGDPEAMHTLADAYRFGLSFPKSSEKAVLWFDRLANRPMKLTDEKKYQQWAWRTLGVMLARGEGTVKPGPARAVVWLKKAADPVLQDGYAEYVLASLYTTGRGVPQDDKEATTLMYRAANHAWPDAMSDWGAWLINGRAGYRSPREAAEWFKKAADKNHTTACYNLGILYETGLGVDKNVDEAKQWYEKAAKYGHQKAKDAVARLTTEP
ncbi:MAG: tetratricopeptide repeat protein [Armatimonas sp.]